MCKKFSNSLKFFSVLLCQRFVVKRQEAIEVIMMLVAGNLMGFYNPNQLADYLGINKTELYRRIKDWSVYQWPKMLLLVGCEYALPMIRDAKRKSNVLCVGRVHPELSLITALMSTTHKHNAPRSRRRLTISVDDTVIKRCGRLLSYTYSWWSGQYKRTVICVRCAPESVYCRLDLTELAELVSNQDKY